MHPAALRAVLTRQNGPERTQTAAHRTETELSGAVRTEPDISVLCGRYHDTRSHTMDSVLSETSSEDKLKPPVPSIIRTSEYNLLNQ